MDGDIVSRHYNEREQMTRDERTTSPIIALRCVNNWIKSVLIEDHVPRDAVYLDLCGGRFGDGEKAAHAGVRSFTLVDIAEEEVARARERWNNAQPNRRVPDARFFCDDAFARSQTTATWALASHYDVVSCQLALHYAFESETKLRNLLRNVAQSLKPNGVFMTSFTDGERVYATCFDLTTHQEKEFDNGICRIRFDYGKPAYIYGTRYRFSLGDAIRDCPEYCVHLQTLINEARMVGLHLVRTQTFDELCHSAIDRCPQHRDKWSHMVQCEVPQNQWHVIGLYRACVFVRDEHPLPPLYGPTEQQPEITAERDQQFPEEAKADETLGKRTKKEPSEPPPPPLVLADEEQEEEEEEKVPLIYARKPNNVAVVRDGRALDKGERVKNGDKFIIKGNIYVRSEKGWELKR